jgi:hypothetical protein
MARIVFIIASDDIQAQCSPQAIFELPDSIYSRTSHETPGNSLGPLENLSVGNNSCTVNG